MSTITFYYSTMAAGKSAHALQMRYNLKRAGFEPLLMKPQVDTRDKGVVKSRIGLEAPCISFDDRFSRDNVLGIHPLPTHVIVDEAQFLNQKTFEQFRLLADIDNIQIICYGLRTTYKGTLFEGSRLLFTWADKLIELPLIDSDGNNTIAHILTINNQIVKDGDDIYIGDAEYQSVSRANWFKKLKDL